MRALSSINLARQTEQSLFVRGEIPRGQRFFLNRKSDLIRAQHLGVPAQPFRWTEQRHVFRFESRSSLGEFPSKGTPMHHRGLLTVRSNSSRSKGIATPIAVIPGYKEYITFLKHKLIGLSLSSWRLGYLIPLRLREAHFTKKAARMIGAFSKELDAVQGQTGLTLDGLGAIGNGTRP